MKIAFLLLMAAGLCAGCSDDPYRVEWTTVAYLPSGASLGSDLVVIPEGIAVSARPTVFKDDEQQTCHPVVTSADPDILQVTDSTRGSPVLSGIAVGKTALTIACDGRNLTVFADVIPQ